MIESLPPFEKACCRCAEIKPLTEFYKDKSRLDGHTYECKDCRKARSKTFYEGHRESVLDTKALYYQRNRLAILASKSESGATRVELAGAARKRWQSWMERNPGAKEAAKRRYVARLAGCSGEHSPAEIFAMYEDQGGLCAYCETPLGNPRFASYHVDHMTPLSRGGVNDWTNLAITCPTCNVSKQAKTAEEFMEYLMCRASAERSLAEVSLLV